MLIFGIYPKPKQTLKFVDNQSCHRQMVFSIIPTGIFARLGCLTSITVHGSFVQDKPLQTKSTYNTYVTYRGTAMQTQIFRTEGSRQDI
eukprot:1042780-Ditylum_brightwellii.AAC.1